MGVAKWDAFDTSTEAGRLLKRLYGASAGHPNIEYPKLNLGRTNANDSKIFIPAGAKVGATDPRAATRRTAVIKVPRRPRASPEVHAIDRVQHRRNKEAINQAIVDTRMRSNAYRPPATRAVSTLAEKARVQEKFQYGGGKALPEEMIHWKGPLPSQLRRDALERERVEKEWRKRREAVEGNASSL